MKAGSSHGGNVYAAAGRCIASSISARASILLVHRLGLFGRLRLRFRKFSIIRIPTAWRFAAHSRNGLALLRRV